MAKTALGRGLGALLGGAPVEAPRAPAPPPDREVSSAVASPVARQGEFVERVSIARLHPCPFQPRKDFSDDALQELAESIRQQGIVQPLIVRASGDGGFELIAGERRWRAAQMAGLQDLPVIVRKADDRAVLEMALIENLQRENLNPIEEAQGYAQLIGQFALTQEDAAGKVGKSRAVVANALRLLRLPGPIQGFVRDGRLSIGHAKVILGLPSGTEQELAAERVLKNSLNVRQTEELVAQWQHRTSRTDIQKSGKDRIVPDGHVAALERRVQERFGTKVHLRYRKGKGALEIHYYSDDDLQRVLDLLGVSVD